MGYIVLLLIIIALMIIGFVGARNEKRREYEEKLKEQTLPSGKILPPEDVLSELTPTSLEALLLMSNDDYEAYLQKEDSFDKLLPPAELTGAQRVVLQKDLDWVVNYAGHRLPEKKEEGDPWINLFLVGSRVKNKYHWIS